MADRSVTFDIIGRDKASKAFESAEKSAGGLQERVGKFKVSFMEAWAAGQVLGQGLQFVGKVINEGITQGLIRANAQVALGASGYAKFSAQAQSTAHSLGLTQGEFLNSAGQAAILAKNMGFGQETAAKFGSQLPDLANKLSLMSSGTRSAAESSDMLRSALAGEFDPLQAVGINITANIVAMKALAIQQENGGRLSEQQATALAVLRIVQEQTASSSSVLNTEQGRQAQKVAATTAAWRDQWQQIEGEWAPRIVGALDFVWRKDQEFVAAVMDPGKADAWVAAFEAANSKTAIAGGVSKGYADALDLVARKTVDATWTTKDYTNALDSNKNVLLGLRGDETAYWKAVDDANKAVRENGRTLDVHSEKGRANRQALDGMASASLRLLGTMQAQNAPAAQFNATLDAERVRLEATAVKFGMTKAQAHAYAQQILGIPHQANTAVNLNAAGALSTLEAVRARLDRINGRVVRAVVVTDYQGSVSVPRGVVGMRAEGGPVRAGQPYVVGEKRAELFVPEQNGTVIPRTNGFRGGGGGTVVLNVNVTQPLGSARDIAAAVQNAIVSASKSGSLSVSQLRQTILKGA